MDEELVTGGEAFFRFLINAMSFICMIILFVCIQRDQAEYDPNLSRMSWELALGLAFAISYGAAAAFHSWLFASFGDVRYCCSFFAYFVVISSIIALIL